MFEDRSYKRTFYSAPQSVESLIAAFLEPSIIVLCYLAVSTFFDEPILRSSLTLCLLVFALTFPGRNRFSENRTSAVIDVLGSWMALLVILALCGYATNSMGYFEDQVLYWWAGLTPVAQILAIELGRFERRRRAGATRRGVVIVGGGPLGAKVARALRDGPDKGIDFLGYFDDRQDERLHPEATPHLLGMLKDLSDYVRQHSVREVYITLPLGSQPRIVQLLEQIQGTTASLFFVPDVFGISIIQGRLQDMNGVPVVGICETPFTGTNDLIKRISDIVLASLILVLISPILLMIAIGVKRSSPGPIIFKQRRNGPGWGRNHRLQIPLDEDPGQWPCGEASDQGRCPHHQVRGLHSTHFAGRTAAIHQCVARTYEHCGPAPPRGGPQRRVSKADQSLYGSTQGQTGHYRLGPGERPARRDRYHR